MSLRLRLQYVKEMQNVGPEERTGSRGSNADTGIEEEQFCLLFINVLLPIKKKVSHWLMVLLQSLKAQVEIPLLLKDTELNSIFINQKQRTVDNKIDLTQQALAKIILINDKAV